MEKEFSSIAETIYFNEEEHLRERTESPPDVREYIQRGLFILENNSLPKNEVYVMRGMIGNLSRIVGDTDQAVHMLTQNVQSAIDVNDRQQEIVSRIRLGEAQKYAGAFGDAMKEFQRANKMIDRYSIEHLRDFVYQHMGKLFLEQGDYKKALDLFQKAYAIRLEKGETELLSSTEEACTYARKKLEVTGPSHERT